MSLRTVRQVAAVVRELAAMVASPLVCLAVGHRPHVWPHHASPGLSICDRCWRAIPR